MTATLARRTIGYINLAVRDYARSVAFYRDVLGLPLLLEDSQFEFAQFDAGTVRFAVVGGPESKKMRDARGGDFHAGIAFCVPDVDAAHRMLAARGVRFTMTPSKQPWGGYMALYADPDGNIFYLDTPRVE
jgi:predicted enzyme related to lactoylglutathione lyase